MDWDKKNIIGGIVIIAASNLTGSLNAIYPDFRADGFTGLDAKDLESKLRQEHDEDCEKIRRDLQAIAIKIALNEYKLGECKKHIEKGT